VRTFHAAVVEQSIEYDTLTVHFDNEKDQYLQFQSPEKREDALDWVDGYGAVDVIVDDQHNSGQNCFSEVELRRDRFRIVFARDPHMTRLGGVDVTFDLDDAAFAELRAGLEFVFRDYPGFRVVPSPGA
jgi:hypothetical protein